MPIVKMRELLEAGVHYGHHTSRWNPKMKRYIYKSRHSIHVIDLRETVRGLVRATRFLSSVAEQGAEFILVGTKKQARQTVVDEANRGEIHYVSERWLGGMLTNFSVVMSRVKRLHELEDMDASGEIEAKGKKYASVLRREMAKLQKNLNGVREMKRTPDVMIIVDPRRERNALREALNLDIPTICFIDTDSDPDDIDIVIPGNDDAMRSVQLICSKLMDAILEGRANRPVAPEVEAEIAIPAAEAAAPAAAPETAAAAEASPAAEAEAPAPESASAEPAEPEPEAEAPATEAAPAAEAVPEPEAPAAEPATPAAEPATPAAEPSPEPVAEPDAEADAKPDAPAAEPGA